MSKAFTLLWGKILDSSVWMTSKETRLVWITMLCMKDADGIVRASLPGLAYRARVSLEECMSALDELSSPDQYSSSPDHEGRRIKHIEGVGWSILNHEKYMFSTEAKRAYWAETKRLQRLASEKKNGHRVKNVVTRAERMEEQK